MRILHVSHSSRRGQKSLAGDAAAIDAGSSNVSTGKDGTLQPLSTGVQRCAVAAHAASNNRDIQVVLSTLASVETNRATRSAKERLKGRGQANEGQAGQQSNSHCDNTLLNREEQKERKERNLSYETLVGRR
jgi:hypothetical protein